MKKTIALLMTAFMLVSCFACTAAAAPAASETDDWSYIQSKGTLVIGYTEYAPMNYTENGTLVGFDTEFAEAVCAKLNLKPEFVEIDWDTKELELAGKKIDCIWNGLTVTEERKSNMDFTVSYLKNQQVVVVRSEDAGKYADAADVFRKVIAISPWYALGHYGLGKTSLYLPGEMDDAIKELRTAVELDPELARAYFYLGMVAKVLDDFPGVGAGTGGENGNIHILGHSSLGIEVCGFWGGSGNPGGHPDKIILKKRELTEGDTNHQYHYRPGQGHYDDI